MARRAPARRRRLRLRALSGCASVPASRKQGLGGRGLGLEEVAKLAPGKGRGVAYTALRRGTSWMLLVVGRALGRLPTQRDSNDSH